MKSASKLLLALVAIGGALVSTALPQAQKSAAGTAVAEVTRLEQESVKADLANDPSFVKQYYAEDYAAGSSWGDWETKASLLKDMSDTKANKTNKETNTDLKVRTYGDTAIATYTQAYDILYHGEHRVRTTICADTWVKQGTWKLVAGHCSQRAK